MTIKQYCDARGVTKQYVGEYIKKGRIPSLDLPLFAEYEGMRIEVGTQKFVVVAPAPSAEMPPRERAAWMAAQATQHPGIQADIKRVLLARSGGKQLREQTDARYAASPDHDEYQRAMAHVRKLLFDEAQYLLDSVQALARA